MAEIGEIELHPETCKVVYLITRSAISTTLVNLCRADGFDDFSKGRYANMDVEKAKTFIYEEQEVFRKHSIGRLGVFLRSNGLPIGMCGLYKMSDPSFLDTIGISYRFPKEHWEQGYASEAAVDMMKHGFESLKLKSISAIIDPSNSRSHKVVEKIGMKLVDNFTYKGELRQHWIGSCR